jgi:hypothetical protein
MTTPQKTPKVSHLWVALILLALTSLGYALISYGEQQRFNYETQQKLEQLRKEKVDGEVFRVTVESINTQLKDIKTNTDYIPDLKAKIEEHIRQK